MLVYKCDGCGKIIGKGDVLYNIEITELAPDVGSWRKHKRSCELHLREGCYATFSVSASIKPKLEPAWPGEDNDNL